MRILFFLSVIVFSGYFGWNNYSYLLDPPKPLYEEPYVVVYGRNSCAHTKQAIKDLEDAGIPFEYESVDNKNIADQLHSRMRKSGIDTRRYDLPVIDVSNEISVRPNSDSIIRAYDESTL